MVSIYPYMVVFFTIYTHKFTYDFEKWKVHILWITCATVHFAAVQTFSSEMCACCTELNPLLWGHPHLEPSSWSLASV